MYTFDSDQNIKDIYGILELFKIIHNKPLSIPCDMIKSGFVEIQGFKRFNLENRNLVENNFTLHSSGQLGGTNYFVKNFKKYYNIEIYHTDTINGERVFEDILFTLDIKNAGFCVKMCEQLWCNTPKGFSESTIEEFHTKESNIEGNLRTRRAWMELQGLEYSESAFRKN